MNPKKPLRREWWLVAGFIIAIAVGALLPSYFSASEEYNAPDLSKKETLAEILDQAIGLDKIQYRGKRGEELRYAQNESAPYTGWVKVMFENGQVAHLFQFIDGKMHGIQTGWAKNGQKNYEVHFKENSQDGRVTAWWGHGQKMMEGQFVDGKLISAESWTLEGNANGKQVIDGNGKIRIGRGQNDFFKQFIPVENGVASIDSSGPEDFLGKILNTRHSLIDWVSWVRVPHASPPPLRIVQRLEPQKQQPLKQPGKPTPKKPAPLKPPVRSKPKSISTTVVKRNIGGTASQPKIPKISAPAIKDMKRLRQLSAAIRVNVSGANRAAFTSYANLVVGVYRRTWEPLIPSGLARPRIAKVSVTIGRSGRVLSARIIRRTGDAKLDHSIQRALDMVKTIGKPFPLGSKDSQRTFTLDFTPLIRGTPSKPKAEPRSQPRSNPIKVDPNAVNKLRENLSTTSRVSFLSGTPSYNRYKDVVTSVYQAKWNRGLPPKSASYRGKVIRVRVTVSKTGRVISARIVGRSGMVALDSSVEATLNAVRSIGQPFPPGVRESQQTFTINFQDKR